MWTVSEVTVTCLGPENRVAVCFCNPAVASRTRVGSSRSQAGIRLSAAPAFE